MTGTDDALIGAPTGEVSVRLARPEDLAAVAEIVNHYIAGSSVNFRTEPQTPAEWTADHERSHERYPWLVAELSITGEVVGVAYAGAWKARQAYDWTVESTVYVRAGLHRAGVGRMLYARLLELLRVQGFRTVLAAVGLPNPDSVAFHESFGYQRVGVFVDAGFKLGRWHDVGFWQLRLSTDEGAPSPVLSVARAAELLGVPGGLAPGTG